VRASASKQLRAELRAERRSATHDNGRRLPPSYSGLRRGYRHEVRIPPDDLELLEAAGVPESVAMNAYRHAYAIRALPDDTRELVADALRVRAMDVVGDRLHSDHGDLAADVIRVLDPDADASNAFDPDNYG
jgi:hypothetical protein